MKLAFVTGRTPLLSQKEIVASATILPFQWSASIVQPDVVLLKPSEPLPEGILGEDGFVSAKMKNVLQDLQKRLGGTIKIVFCEDEELTQHQISERLYADVCANMQEGRKQTVGLSIHGALNPTQLARQVKEEVQGLISLRWVLPTQGSALSSVQVTGNKLLREDRREIVLISEGRHWLMGRTVAVQNVEDYRERDFSIPAPNAHSGMLPPKLAQAMINCALGGTHPGEATVIDPFCGNGRVVTEALLMGADAYGSDIAADKVRDTRLNIPWIAKRYGLELAGSAAEHAWQADATSAKAADTMVGVTEGKRRFVVSEPYLGPPLRRPLPENDLPAWRDELAELYLGFFTAWAPHASNIEAWTVVFPRVKVQGGREFSLFDYLVDRLREIGYSFEQISLYGRADALVERQLVKISYGS